MTIFTQSEQDEVEFRDPCKFARIGSRTRIRSALGRDVMNIAARDGHVIEPGRASHPAITLGVIRWQATLVAEPDLPAWPVGLGRAQALVDSLRRVTSRKDEVEDIALAYRLPRRIQNKISNSLFQPRCIGKNPPTALL